MKIILYQVLALLSTLQLSAKSSRTQTSVAHNIIVQCIWGDFQKEKKPLPESFDDIPSLHEAARKDPRMISLINELALVPGAPVVKPQDGISLPYQRKRVFAIGRTKNRDYSETVENSTPEQGRYAILLEVENNGGYSCWIPESQVQEILKQVEGYNPEKLPLAFKDLLKGDERRPVKRPPQTGTRDNLPPPLSKKNRVSNGQAISAIHGEQGYHLGIIITSLILLVVPLVIWIRSRVNASKLP